MAFAAVTLAGGGVVDSAVLTCHWRVPVRSHTEPGTWNSTGDGKQLPGLGGANGGGGCWPGNGPTLGSGTFVDSSRRKDVTQAAGRRGMCASMDRSRDAVVSRRCFGPETAETESGAWAESTARVMTRS